eukprot:UN10314
MFEAMCFWKNEQKKMEKITNKLEKTKGNPTSGGKSTTEMQSIQKRKDEKKECLVGGDEEYNNMQQGALTSGVCCGN